MRPFFEEPSIDMTPPACLPISDKCVEGAVASRFRKVVATYPQRLAVDDGRTALVYQDLDALSDRIAATILQQLDGGKQQRIAVYLEKSTQYIAAILGILKSGHVYVPTDTDFPYERNSFILTDSQAALLLTNSAHLDKAGALMPGECQLLNLDDIPTSQASDCPEVNITPDDLAYIIYTSGSTGKPKGVVQNQRNTLHGCKRRTELQEITPEDRISLFYSCSVMGSVYCIFGALLNGASLHLYNIREQGVDQLGDWLIQQTITIYHSVASVFRTFADCCQLFSEDFSVRLVIFGGEKVLTSDVTLAREVFGQNISFFTGLGATETGTIRHFHIAPDTMISTDIVPIGYPVEGVTVELRDEHGKPVPRGEIGEITVISPYIALGYWNNPGATDKVFSSLPDYPDIRVYRMGDLAQETAEGMLEHRGRKDFQVKVRGFRIETGEVESALHAFPGILEAVVTAREVGRESKLIAYIAQTKEHGACQLSVTALNAHMKERVPYYMLPSRYVLLDTLPKTPNNKIDRNALPAPVASNELQNDDGEPAATETESILLELVSALLRRTGVGVNHNFFELGGDSLSATQLAARIRKHMGLELPMRSIFMAANLRVLAAELDQLRSVSSRKDGIPSIQPVSRDQRLAPSYAQKLMWVINRLHGSSAAYNISNSVRLSGALDISALGAAINTIIERHEVLRTVFPADRKGPYQHILPFVPLEIPLMDLRHLPIDQREATASDEIQRDLQTPHNLETGPLFHVRLIRLSDTEHVLSMIFNHIIYDNIWSSALFFNELNAAYAACRQGVEPQLPPLEVQFTDFAEWERQSLSQSALDESLSYWREMLADPPPPLPFPTDRPRQVKPSMKGAQIRFEVPPALRLDIEQLCRRNTSTLFMVMLTAWNALLAMRAGRPEVLVGTPTGRRRLEETERLIGLFINTLVLRSRLSPETGFDDLLLQMKQQLVNAFSYENLPFELLIRELKPPQSPGISPYFQHFFIHRNATQHTWQLDGLKLTPLHMHQGGSKFDMTLSILENEYALTGTLEYSVDLFDESTVRGIIDAYLAVLETAVHEPQLPFSQYSVKGNLL